MPLELVQTTLTPRQAPVTSSPDPAAEANHRIANSLALIAGLVRLHASSIVEDRRVMSAEEIRLTLEEFGGRVETVGRLHRLLANSKQAGPVDLADYLRGLADAVVSSLSLPGQVELSHTSNAICLVDPEQSLSLGLIVGEMMTNAIKYAHPTGVTGKISVGCRKASDGAIVVETSDDGVGLPEGFDPMTGGKLGFRLVRTLATRLGADLVFDDCGIGLCFQLRLPGRAASGPRPSFRSPMLE